MWFSLYSICRTSKNHLYALSASTLRTFEIFEIEIHHQERVALGYWKVDHRLAVQAEI